MAMAASTSAAGARDQHADGLDLVDAGVGGVAAAVGGGEADLAAVSRRRRSARRLSPMRDFGTVMAFMPPYLARGGRKRQMDNPHEAHERTHWRPAPGSGQKDAQNEEPTPWPISRASPSPAGTSSRSPARPTCPDRVLRAMDNPTMDHRGPDFGKLGLAILEKVKPVFGTAGHVVIYPASGTGAWEAALVNTLSPGDRVLMSETGWFATLWREMAERLGLQPEFLPSDWRSGADPAAIEAALRADKAQAIKAVCVVHNETSTGCTTRVDEVRQAMDAAGHPALLLVDTISSLGSIEYQHDAWGVDVTVAGSQKGLMLPPGLSFNAVSEKALKASETARLPRASGTGSR
jgi:hypothetical protein